MQKAKFDNIACSYVAGANHDKIAYVIYPLDMLDDWIESAAASYGTSIAVITGVDWDNDLTPWPAVGVPAGSPNFKGLAPSLLKKLTEEIAPEIERSIGVSANVVRTLVGVSLSGLFTLWQWPGCDFFKNIATLSGSFWYKGFVDWICKQSFANKKGRCYMLLGREEPKSPDPMFRTVGVCTDKIVAYLHQQGVDVTFEIVPGNHFQYGIQRLDRAFAFLFK